MMLTDKQRKILCSVQLQASASVTKIAEETGYREHTVRYCLEDLRSRGILEAFAFVDPSALGYGNYVIYFSRAAESKLSRHEFVKALLQSPRTGWVAEFGGDFQYGVSIFARNVAEVNSFLSVLIERCGGCFFEKSFALPVSWTMFRCKYLSSHETSITSLSGGGVREEVQIDELDHRILQDLSNNRLVARTKMAKNLGIPATTLEYRIKRLEKIGVIAGYAYRVNPQLFGSQTFVLMIYAKAPTTDLTSKVYEFSAAHPHVTHYTHCMGSWDYELRLEVKGSREVAGIVQEIYDRFGAHISNVSILTLFDTMKFSTYPFIEVPNPAAHQLKKAG